MENITEKFKKYLEITKEIADIKKSINEKKKITEKLGEEIYKHMVDNEIDSINIAEGEIVLYQRKVPQKFKKENIIETINETIKNPEISEKLTDKIMNNKVCSIESKIRAIVKK